MARIRVIPILLLKNSGLVKTIKFKDPKYVGDPRNAVKIFNDKEVDELSLLDITASNENRPPNFKIISEIASECFMPLSYGGGITSLEQIRQLFNIGVEKIVLNTYALVNPLFIRQAADQYGSQSIVISLDIRKNFWGKYELYSNSGEKHAKPDPQAFAVQAQELGAGEILVNSIDRDGTMSGYDTELLKKISSIVDIPVIACGGAGKITDFAEAVFNGGASAVAAGSMFVFHGKHRAVLINYPSPSDLKAVFTQKVTH